jgi:hypothetical protein
MMGNWISAQIRRSMRSVACMLVAVTYMAGCSNGDGQGAGVVAHQLAVATVSGGVATFTGKRASYTISKTSFGYIVKDSSGVSTNVSGASAIRFADFTVNLEVGDKAVTISAADLKRLVELYIGFFNRVPDADGMAYWIDTIKGGRSLDQLGDNFYDAGVALSSVTGYSATMSNADFVRIIYKNVLGRTGATAPSDDEVNYWAGEIVNGHRTRGSLVNTMLDSAHATSGDPNYGWVSQLLDNKYSVGKYFAITQGLNFNDSTAGITSSVQIAEAVTSNSTSQALLLIGVNDTKLSLVATTPDAPAITDASSGNGTAVISFTAPSVDGGSAVTGYNAACTGGGTTVSASSSAGPITVSGLSSGTTYSCTVAAINAVGSGAVSATVSVTPSLPLQSYSPPVVSGTPVATLSGVIGNYQRLPVENDYHVGQISLQTGSTTVLKWTNQAGLSWTLTPDLANGMLRTDSTNPYQKTGGVDFTLAFADGKVSGFYFSNEFYARDGVPILKEQGGLHGYLSHGMNDSPAGYTYGVSAYMAMWPMVDQPTDNFQAGMGTWITPDNFGFSDALLPPTNALRLSAPERGPTWADVFQTIEGGEGYWLNAQYPVKDPKYHINGTIDGYDHLIGSPGWNFFGSLSALDRDTMSIAQLSNRLLTPPDGFTFRKGTAGEFFGFAWMALPLTEARPGTVPVGDQSWTLFFNAANFAGPVAFWVPDAWTRLSQSYATDIGRGLDTRPGSVSSGAIEFGSIPGYVNTDSKGATYLRIPRILFPVDGNGVSYLFADWTRYSAAALYTPTRQWFSGGNAITGTFDTTAGNKPSLVANGFQLTYGSNTPVTGLDKFVSTAVVNLPGGGSAFGLKWTGSGTPGVLPEYYQLSSGSMVAVSADQVPAETNLSKYYFSAPSRVQQPYTSPTSGTSSWATPAPAAGPFTATLSDGSVVTYYWYRFIDQPALQGFSWTTEEKARLQARVESIHTAWGSTRTFMPKPSAGTLATLDQGLFVNPPAGLEIGYVPIVTRQAMP